MAKIITVWTKGQYYPPEVADYIKRQLPDVAVIGKGQDIEPIYGYTGWWSKLEIFRPDIKGDILYIDLDTQIKGDISHYLDLKKDHVLSDFYFPDKSIGSGLMYLTHDTRMLIHNDLHAVGADNVIQMYRGDQDYINKFLYKTAIRWQDAFPNQVLSYKQQYRPDLSNNKYNPVDDSDLRVLCYHGNPKPWYLGE